MTGTSTRGSTLLALLLLLVLGVAPAVAADANAEPLDLEAELAEMMGLFPGGAVALVQQDGVVETAAVGFANADGEPMTIDSGFRVGWIGLGHIATMVLQLAEEGRIDLDEPIATYVPDLAFGGDETIRSLLTMDTTLTDVIPEMLYRWTLDPHKAWTNDEALDVAAALQADDPEAVNDLSSTNPALLIKLIEELGATSIQEAHQRRIAGPLGLETTSYPGSAIPENLSAGWLPNVGLEGQSDIGGMDSFAGVRTTAPELATFMHALANGELVSPELVSEIFTDRDTPLTLGSMFAPSRMRYEGEPYFGWWQGDVSGYTYELIFDPDSGDIAIVLTNHFFVDTLPVMESIVDHWAAEDG